MFKKRKKFNSLDFVAIEIDWTELTVAAVSPNPDGTVNFRTRVVDWRQEASSLQTAEGQQELAESLKRVCHDLKVSAEPAYVSLSGDFCVTRVATGMEDEVRHELEELERRSELYLSLGYGPKALAASISQIDARHRHAMMTVVHQNTLEATIEAAARANLKLKRVEPSLVSLCRLIAELEEEADGPALIVQLAEREVEVGITYRGRLLLDYRPAGLDESSQVATTLLRHLNRLKRYCFRYARFAKGELENVYVCGPPEEAEKLKASLEESGQLNVRTLTQPWFIDDNWKSDEGGDCWSMLAPVGASLLSLRPDEEITCPGPNLLERMQAVTREPLGKLLKPLAWPLAASVLISLAAWSAVWWQHGATASLQAELDQHAMDARDARMLQNQSLKAQTLVAEYQRIESALDMPGWSQITEQIAHCLPQNAWLDRLELTREGQLVLSGACYSDDAPFEFVRWLNEIPQLKRVALDGTRPARLTNGMGTRFDVHCEINKAGELGDSNDGNA